MVNGQAAILQVDHRADVHGVWQEGGRRHYARRMLHRRQCLRSQHAPAFKDSIERSSSTRGQHCRQLALSSTDTCRQLHFGY